MRIYEIILKEFFIQFLSFLVNQKLTISEYKLSGRALGSRWIGSNPIIPIKIATRRTNALKSNIKIRKRCVASLRPISNLIWKSKNSSNKQMCGLLTLKLFISGEVEQSGSLSGSLPEGRVVQIPPSQP